jgi:hypothetical protein
MVEIAMGKLTRQSSITNADPADDCREAITLGVARLIEMKIDPTLYKLVNARNLIVNPSFAGPQLWQLTFKLRTLIPKAPDSEVGAGGEAFIEVDLSRRKAELRYGE